MPIVVITGSSGLVGSESSLFFSNKGFEIIGIDNNLRHYFFGEEANTSWNKERIKSNIKKYKHYNEDIRNKSQIESIFSYYQHDIHAVIHCAAQPSHDWAAKEPFTDFSVNALGTLNLLEMTRKYAPDAAFIFTSTNKVYGDRPNLLPLIEQEMRWEIDSSHLYFQEGIDETMNIDQTTHSLFGASKTAGDILVQEYGRYFGMKTVCFRGGCISGPAHSGTKLHGFLAYLVKCAIQDTPYQIIGHKGKQVRDIIHSFDLVNAFWHYYLNPRSGEVYNIGGGRSNHCSVLEAINLCEQITEKKLRTHYTDMNRQGDHIWWISNLQKFKNHYPNWKMKYNIETIICEIFEMQKSIKKGIL